MINKQIKKHGIVQQYSIILKESGITQKQAMQAEM